MTYPHLRKWDLLVATYRNYVHKQFIRTNEAQRSRQRVEGGVKMISELIAWAPHMAPCRIRDRQVVAALSGPGKSPLTGASARAAHGASLTRENTIAAAAIGEEVDSFDLRAGGAG